jgi:uncharacterized protein (TIGR03083 family)
VKTYTDSIKEHSDALARLAPSVLDVPVEHCPGWTVEDLIGHLIGVHWFWATVVEHRLSTRPEEGRPVDVPRNVLVERFAEGADHLVNVLRSATQSDHVWTRSPVHQDVAFVTRHQVQEIAVHHWDAAHAGDQPLAIASDVASDAIAEFLENSVSSLSDPADPPRPPLNGELGLWSSDANQGWTIYDAEVPGTVGFREGVDSSVSTLTASSSDLLLWLYARVEVRGGARANELAERFRALCFTD